MKVGAPKSDLLVTLQTEEDDFFWQVRCDVGTQIELALSCVSLASSLRILQLQN